MGFFGWLTIIIFIIIIIAIINRNIIADKKSTMESKVASMADFNPTQQFIGNDGHSGIAIDEDRKKVCLITHLYGNNMVNTEVLSYQDLISSEVFEDEKTITSTSRSSQIGGALVGGIAFGGVGAIIGGLSGKTTSTQKPKRIDLRITVNRTASPIHDVNFMNIETEREGIIYTVALQQARHWHGLISILIRQADEEYSPSRSKIASSNSIYIPDEIRKLAQLRDERLISDEEFVAQKAKLLA